MRGRRGSRYSVSNPGGMRLGESSVKRRDRLQAAGWLRHERSSSPELISEWIYFPVRSVRTDSPAALGTAMRMGYRGGFRLVAVGGRASASGVDRFTPAVRPFRLLTETRTASRPRRLGRRDTTRSLQGSKWCRSAWQERLAERRSGCRGKPVVPLGVGSIVLAPRGRDARRPACERTATGSVTRSSAWRNRASS